MCRGITRTAALLLSATLLLPLASCKAKDGKEDQVQTPSGSYDDSGAYRPAVPPRLEELARLSEKNQDAVGWLQIPNTTVDEGVVQAGDNEHYLRKDVYGKYSYEGCYFLDFESLPGDNGLLSRNTIIYGHNLGKPMGVRDDPDGVKFAQLLKFEEEEFARKTPYLYYTTPAKTFIFEVFAAFYCEAETSPVPYHYADYPDEQFLSLVRDAKERSEFLYEAQPAAGDKILTLSTCTYKYGTYSQNPDQRFVVMGRLMREGDAYSEDAKLEKNPSPKPPKF